MADDGKRGEGYAGGTGPLRLPLPPRKTVLSGRGDTNADEPLLDISCKGFEEEALILDTGGQRTDLLAGAIKETSNLHGSDTGQREKAIGPGVPVAHDATPITQKSSTSPSQQVRFNPFDSRRPSEELLSATQRPDNKSHQEQINTLVLENPSFEPVGAFSSTSGYPGLDQYDQLNFGDPTFISSYSSATAYISTVRQHPVYSRPCTQSSVSEVKLVQRTLYDSRTRPDTQGPVSSVVTRRNLPDVTAVGTSLSRVNPPAGDALTSLPMGGGRRRDNSSFVDVDSPTSHSFTRPGDGRHSKSFTKSACSTDVATDLQAGRLGSPIDIGDQHHNSDLILLDYTLTSDNQRAVKSNVRSFPQSGAANKSREKSLGGNISLASATKEENQNFWSEFSDSGTSKLGAGLIRREQMSGEGNRDRSFRDKFKGDDLAILPRDGDSELDRYISQRHSEVSFAPAEETRGTPVPVQAMSERDHATSHWDEAEDERYEERAPLLDAFYPANASDSERQIHGLGVKSDHKSIRNVTLPPGANRAVQSDVATSQSSLPHQEIMSPHLGIYYETGAHSMARHSNERDALTKHQLKSGENYAIRNVEDPNQNRQLRGGDRTLWQRNSYGEFSPLPHVSENGSAELAGRNSYHLTTRHCHKRIMGSLTDKVARRQLIAVVVLCLMFMIGEAIGGALSNSLALFTDVLHLGSDLVSFIISLLALWLANKPATKKMSFGYHRAEVIGALFSVFLIWLVSGILCYIAIERILHEHYMDVKPNEMLITASLGVVFNIIMGFVLHSERCCKGAHSHNKFGHGHSHGGDGHGHSHHKDDLLDVANREPLTYRDTGRGAFGYQPLEEAADSEGLEQQMRDVNSDVESDEMTDEEALHKHKNINVRAAFIHVVGDILQSIGVLIAALIIKFTSEDKYKLADPICTFLFSVLVLITTITVLRDTLLVIMEGVPRDLSFQSLKRELAALDGVVTVHSLHVWALTLDRNALSVHLAVENQHIHNQVLSSATKLIQDRHHFFHSTIQVELYDEVIMNNCKECIEFN